MPISTAPHSPSPCFPHSQSAPGAQGVTVPFCLAGMKGPQCPPTGANLCNHAYGISGDFVCVCVSISQYVCVTLPLCVSIPQYRCHKDPQSQGTIILGPLAVKVAGLSHGTCHICHRLPPVAACMRAQCQWQCVCQCVHTRVSECPRVYTQCTHTFAAAC